MDGNAAFHGFVIELAPLYNNEEFAVYLSLLPQKYTNSSHIWTLAKMPFQYKKVLVLGATSGIGWAMAKKFLDQGSSVIVTGRRKENLDDFQRQYGQDGRVDTAVFDVTNLKNIQNFANETISKHPDLDCIFLNAGIQRHLNWREPESVNLDSFEKELTTNFVSYIHLTKAFLPHLQRQAPKDVALIYVTSGLALVPVEYCSGYCASKAALHHMILVLRLQMKEINSNVKIIELLPPAVQTELHADKHQPEFKGQGKYVGMPLEDFVEEAWTGLNSDDNEQVAVQAVKSFMGFEEWEQERQTKVSHISTLRMPVLPSPDRLHTPPTCKSGIDVRRPQWWNTALLINPRTVCGCCRKLLSCPCQLLPKITHPGALASYSFVVESRLTACR